MRTRTQASAFTYSTGKDGWNGDFDPVREQARSYKIGIPLTPEIQHCRAHFQLGLIYPLLA
ncbi:hypothetical protein D1O90_005280 [Escherichia coli]|nr:hypothetical protein [Escherichia coli]